MDELDELQLLFRDSIMVNTTPDKEQHDDDGAGSRKPFRDPDLSERERELMEEVNLLRSDPVTYAELLIRRRKHFYTAADLQPGDPAQKNPNLKEGKPAVLEAIDFLQKCSSVEKISWRRGIHLASQDVRKLLGNQKTTDPTTPDQVNEALYSYGEYEGRATQLVGFGYNNPKEIVCHLLVSDGEHTRRSRQILLDPDFRFGGLALGDDDKSSLVVFHFITEGYWLFDQEHDDQ